MTRDRVLDWLQPGGGLRGPLLASLAERLDDAAAIALAPGDRIGPYAVVALLGRGGMGAVYAATRADGEFEQDVALKVLAGRYDSEAQRTLLRRERQILAALQHPGIARLLDGGTTAAGTLWFAMERVAGERIDAHCRRHGLALTPRLQLFRQACAAVQYAHGHAVVHRDLKPGNILVTEAGEVKLLDFGIAAALRDQAAAAGTVPALTPGWASPEQVRGEPAAIAGDVWQLGRLLGVLLDDLAPRSAASLRDARAIATCAMAEAPAQRYATVADLDADVARLLTRRPVAARHGGAGYRLQRFVSRHRWSTLAATAVVVVLAALSAVFAWRLADERDRALREASRANAATRFLIDLFEGNDPGVHGGETLTVPMLLARGEQRLAGELQAQPQLRAALLQAVGEIRGSLGDYERAGAMLDEAVADARAVVPPDPALLVDTLRAAAWNRLVRGDGEASAALLDEAEALLAKHTRLDVAAFEVAMVRAQWFRAQGRLDEALAAQRAALPFARTHYGERSAQVALIANNQGLNLRDLGRWREAIASFSVALAHYEAQFGPRHTRTANALQNLAAALIDGGELAAANELVTRAVAIKHALYGDDSTQYANALVEQARLHAAAGDCTASAETFARIEAIYRDRLPATHAYHARVLLGGAACKRDAGDATDAREDLVQALALVRTARGDAHPDTAAVLQALATTELLLHDPNAAAHADEAVAILQRHRGIDSDRLARARALSTRAAAAQDSAAPAIRRSSAPGTRPD